MTMLRCFSALLVVWTKEEVWQVRWRRWRRWLVDCWRSGCRRLWRGRTSTSVHAKDARPAR